MSTITDPATPPVLSSAALDTLLMEQPEQARHALTGLCPADLAAQAHAYAAYINGQHGLTNAGLLLTNWMRARLITRTQAQAAVQALADVAAPAAHAIGE